MYLTNLSSDDPKENWTVHYSTTTTLGRPSRKHQDWFDENDDKFRGFLKKSTDRSRHNKMILAQYPRKQHTATFVRQSRPSLGIFLAEKENRRKPVFNGKKGHKAISRCNENHLWPKDIKNYHIAQCRWNHSSSRYGGYFRKVGKILYVCSIDYLEHR